MMKKLSKLILFALVIAAALTPTLSLAATMAQAKERAAEFGKKYGIDVYVDDDFGYGGRYLYYTSDKDAKAIITQLNNLDKEMAKYSKAFYQKAGLETFAIFKSILMDGGHVEGITLYNSTGPAIMAIRTKAQARTFHHEMSHLLDRYSLVDDAKWAALNVPGFRYGDFLKADILPPGVVSSYGGMYVYEDRAEIFSFLMDESKIDKLKKQIAHDDVLRSKLVELKSYLDSYVGDGYWTKNLNSVLAVKQEAKPLYYVVSKAQAKTGPGEGYNTLSRDTSAAMPVVEQSNTYVKVLIGRTGAYFLREDVQKVAAPTATPTATPQTAQPTPAPSGMPTAAPKDSDAQKLLLAIGVKYAQDAKPTADIKFENFTGNDKKELILMDIYNVIRRDGFNFKSVVIVDKLTVYGKAQTHACYKDVLYINASKYTTKKFIAFNKKLLAWSAAA